MRPVQKSGPAAVSSTASEVSCALSRASPMRAAMPSDTAQSSRQRVMRSSRSSLTIEMGSSIKGFLVSMCDRVKLDRTSQYVAVPDCDISYRPSSSSDYRLRSLRLLRTDAAVYNRGWWQAEMRWANVGSRAGLRLSKFLSYQKNRHQWNTIARACRRRWSRCCPYSRLRRDRRYVGSTRKGVGTGSRGGCSRPS